MNPLNDPSQDLLLCEQMILTYTSTTFNTYAATLPTLDGENDSLRAAQYELPSLPPIQPLLM